MDEERTTTDPLASLCSGELKKSTVRECWAEGGGLDIAIPVPKSVEGIIHQLPVRLRA